MDDTPEADVDPTDPEHRAVGRALLEEDVGPSSAAAHLYRGEIHRMRFWRERHDQTTYWASSGVIIRAVPPTLCGGGGF